LPFTERPPQQIIMGQIQKMIDEIPGTQTFVQAYQLINLDLEFGNAGQFQFIVRGQDFPDVEKATHGLTAEYQSHPEFSFVQNSLRNDSPTLVMNLDEERVHRYGFDKKQIQSLLQQAYGQAKIGKIQKGVNEENIYLELLPEFQNHVNAPAKLFLTTSSGG